MPKPIDDNRIHEGHRSRMRAKLSSHGHGIFDTYELLEMLLYYAVPYKDTNPIAKQLLHRFGSLDAVLRADKEELKEVPGVGEAVAELITRAGSVESLLGVDMSQGDSRIFATYTQLGEYLTSYFASADGPMVALMMFDNRMRLIETVKIADFDYDSARILPRDFVDAVIRARASVIITAHCHPAGPIFPSEGDRASNALISAAMSAIGTVHLEHYLVTPCGYIGLINNYAGRYAAYLEVSDFLESKRVAIDSGAASDPADYMPDYYSTTL